LVTTVSADLVQQDAVDLGAPRLEVMLAGHCLLIFPESIILPASRSIGFLLDFQSHLEIVLAAVSLHFPSKIVRDSGETALNRFS
jgi:hypothetical protein